MRDDHDREPHRLGRLETLSAWLGLWTPRDAEVPPVPKRRLAIGAVLVLVAVVAAVAIAIPAIDAGKEEGAAREEREASEARAAERRRLRESQAPHHGRAEPEPPAGLLSSVRESIAADARARVRAGELDGTIRRVECEAGRRAGDRGSYDCTAVISDIPGTGRNVPGRTGHPFVAVVDFETGRYTWCKTNPPPGERVIPDPRDVVELPRECVL